MSNEKDVRLDEVDHLEKHCNDHAVGMDNPDHTIRLFITRRRNQIHELFTHKPEPAPADTANTGRTIPFVAPSK